MAFVTRKITRTSQPQELVGIDSSFITPIDLWVPHASGMKNLVRSRDANKIGANISLEPSQSGFACSGVLLNTRGAYTDTYNDWYAGYSEITLFAVATMRALSSSNWSHLMRLDHNPQYNSQLNLAIKWDGATFRQDALLKTTVNNGWTASSFTIIPAENRSFSLDTLCLHILRWKNGSGSQVSATSIGLNPIWTSVPYNATGVIGAPDTPMEMHIGGLAYEYSEYGFPGQIYIAGVLPTWITDEQADKLSANPWQIFEPIEETIWIPDGVSVTLPTLVQPASTTSAGTWTPVGAATLHEAIDEATPSDADYISVAAASTCELVLAESAFPTGNVSLAYRALSSTGNTLTVTLKQGAATIMTRTHALTGTATLYTQPLTAGEVAAIVAGPVTCTLTSS